ncbi:MAG: septum formation initiator family protein [Acidobacteria bacterium]|nr:septum formation initiator family protein [Acidobacteriota bacterium]
MQTLNKRPKQRGRALVLAHAAKATVFRWRRRVATVAIGGLALGMGYDVVFGHNGLTAYAHKREETKALQLETQQLQRENDDLSERVIRLQFSPDAIEHEAREELHYTRTGEVIYTLPASRVTPDARSTK